MGTIAEKGKRKKIGLALGGGYARGLAHIGVLEVLEREGIPIDIISGTSIGALIGALYAREKDASLIRKQAAQLDWIGVTSLVDLTLPKSGFIGGKRITNLLRRFLGDAQFKDLDIPFACVATDIMSGEEIILNEGSVLEAVRASISIPVIFKVARTRGRFLVDGGLVNQVPINLAKNMGADFIIAVDITPTKAERIEYLLQNGGAVKEPTILQVMAQTIYISTCQITGDISQGANAVIHPHLAHIGPGEFHRAQECILEGELAAVDNLAHIKRHLLEIGITVGRRNSSIKG
jgi:NTE family protein